MHLFIQHKKLLSISLLGMVLFLLIAGCTEPFQGEVAGLEDVLVVNALITNEDKQQEISLSRPYRFSEDSPIAEEMPW